MKSNQRRKESARREQGGLSRREFARGATAAAAAIAAIPGGVLGTVALTTSADAMVSGRTRAGNGRGSAPAMPQQPTGDGPKLSAEGKAEAEAKIAEILRRYGDRLDDAQKSDIRRLVVEGQAPLESLRAFPLENSDEPATVLHMPGVSAPARRAVNSPAARTAAKPKQKPGT